MASRPSAATNRRRSLMILALVVVGGVLGALALRPHDDSLGGGTACQQGAKAQARVETIKAGQPIPLATDYDETSRAIRRSAVTAPAELATSLHAIADGYGILSRYYLGFDPADESTYGIIERNSGDIEREQAAVDQAEAGVERWLRRACA